MKLKAVTDYTLDNFKKFHRFHVYKGSIIKPILYILLILGGIGFCAAMLSVRGDKSYIIFMVMLGVIGLFMLFQYFAMPIMSYKSGSISRGKNIFTFEEEGIRVGEESSQQYKRLLKYKGLYRAYETNDFFYIYMFRQSALIIDKSGFAQGNAEELRRLLNDKMSSDVIDRTR